jgi:hypothetical protein
MQRPERMQESVLHRILGILMRRRDRASHCVGTPLVRPDERAERGGVTALRARHKSLLFRRVQRSERHCGHWRGG